MVKGDQFMSGNKRALVHLGSGMGNMLMATPMIETLSNGGWQIDLCLEGETPNVETLFNRWSPVETVSSNQAPFIPKEYELYIYGFEVNGDPVRFKNFSNAIVLHPMFDWQKGYQLYSEIELYSHLARCVVPNTPLSTQTCCVGSDRIFDDITPDTAVLVPGGGLQMIIRKWGGYGHLAEKLKDVAVVGLPADLDHSNRLVFPEWARKIFGNMLNYQGRGWKIARRFAERYDEEVVFTTHVKNYIGELSLEDTAALISQAGYVIGNDCGVTHMAVALGKPVFPILGPTSRRKVFPSFLNNVTVISRQFDCQPCQEKPSMRVWRENRAQAFCPFGIRCMEAITVDDVIETVESSLGKPITRG